MADLRVDQLTIYPIKSLGGISVRDIRVTWRGPDLDRRWSLVDDQGVVVTQREMPVLSQCIVRVAETDIIVDCKGRNTTLPKTLESGDSGSHSGHDHHAGGDAKRRSTRSAMIV